MIFKNINVNEKSSFGPTLNPLLDFLSTRTASNKYMKWNVPSEKHLERVQTVFRKSQIHIYNSWFVVLRRSADHSRYNVTDLSALEPQVSLVSLF